jgi:CheY-like chemotaxis protein
MPDQPNYRILVVEDQPENGLFLVQLLQAIGFEVEQAENGQDAIVQFQQWQPHLIWMDMRMPILDGYEATRQIRAASSLDTAPKIIALTASAFEDEREAILTAGCDDLVCKPVTEAMLFETMSQHIGVRYLYEEPTAASPIQADQSSDLLTAAALQTAMQAMPSDWIERLQWAARVADEEQILQLLEQRALENLRFGGQHRIFGHQQKHFGSVLRPLHLTLAHVAPGDLVKRVGEAVGGLADAR